MDEGMLWWLGGKLGRRLMRYGVVAVTVVIILLIKPDWPAALLQLRADYVTEKMQGVVDRMVGDQGHDHGDASPVAPGKLRQLRHDMRHR